MQKHEESAVDALLKSRDKTRASIDRAGRALADSSALLSVDLLTDGEIGELRTLIQLGDGAAAHVSEAAADPRVNGMYRQLADSGFIEIGVDSDGGIALFGVRQKAHWAVERHDRRIEAERKRRREERMWHFAELLFGFALGFVANAASPLLSFALKALAQSAGIPLE